MTGKFAAILLALMLTGGTLSVTTAHADDPHLPLITFTRGDGTAVPLAVEVVDDAGERACGLMHRTSLPEEQGMLFVFPQDGQVGGFWMRNTLIPLAIAYVGGDGRIVDILEMEAAPEPGTPYRTADGQSILVRDGERPPPDATWITYTPRSSYQFAIEANAGWYTRHGIQIGDTVDLGAALANADNAAPPAICLQLGT
jgi:uncharacterized membrane protein (UPF0127 family)